ncbi:unnamed protein product [Amoebophrya sp. A120]|nr:unnamed protein product [Amoebophrya sp. A120]|eukprot:GSA120T00019742001.1
MLRFLKGLSGEPEYVPLPADFQPVTYTKDEQNPGSGGQTSVSMTVNTFKALLLLHFPKRVAPASLLQVLRITEATTPPQASPSSGSGDRSSLLEEGDSLLHSSQGGSPQKARSFGSSPRTPAAVVSEELLEDGEEMIDFVLLPTPTTASAAHAPSCSKPSAASAEARTTATSPEAECSTAIADQETSKTTTASFSSESATEHKQVPQPASSKSSVNTLKSEAATTVQSAENSADLVLVPASAAAVPPGFPTGVSPGAAKTKDDDRPTDKKVATVRVVEQSVGPGFFPDASPATGYNLKPGDFLPLMSEKFDLDDEDAYEDFLLLFQDHLARLPEWLYVEQFREHLLYRTDSSIRRVAYGFLCVNSNTGKFDAEALIPYTVARITAWEESFDLVPELYRERRPLWAKIYEATEAVLRVLSHCPEARRRDEAARSCPSGRCEHFHNTDGSIDPERLQIMQGKWQLMMQLLLLSPSVTGFWRRGFYRWGIGAHQRRFLSLPDIVMRQLGGPDGVLGNILPNFEDRHTWHRTYYLFETDLAEMLRIADDHQSEDERERAILDECERILAAGGHYPNYQPASPVQTSDQEQSSADAPDTDVGKGRWVLRSTRCWTERTFAADGQGAASSRGLMIWTPKDRHFYFPSQAGNSCEFLDPQYILQRWFIFEAEDRTACAFPWAVFFRVARAFRLQLHHWEFPLFPRTLAPVATPFRMAMFPPPQWAPWGRITNADVPLGCAVPAGLVPRILGFLPWRFFSKRSEYEHPFSFSDKRDDNVRNWSYRDNILPLPEYQRGVFFEPVPERSGEENNCPPKIINVNRILVALFDLITTPAPGCDAACRTEEAGIAFPCKAADQQSHAQRPPLASTAARWINKHSLNTVSVNSLVDLDHVFFPRTAGQTYTEEVRRLRREAPVHHRSALADDDDYLRRIGETYAFEKLFEQYTTVKASAGKGDTQVLFEVCDFFAPSWPDELHKLIALYNSCKERNQPRENDDPPDGDENVSRMGTDYIHYPEPSSCSAEPVTAPTLRTRGKPLPVIDKSAQTNTRDARRMLFIWRHHLQLLKPNAWTMLDVEFSTLLAHGRYDDCRAILEKQREIMAKYRGAAGSGVAGRAKVSASPPTA